MLRGSWTPSRSGHQPPGGRPPRAESMAAPADPEPQARRADSAGPPRRPSRLTDELSRSRRAVRCIHRTARTRGRTDAESVEIPDLLRHLVRGVEVAGFRVVRALRCKVKMKKSSTVQVACRCPYFCIYPDVSPLSPHPLKLGTNAPVGRAPTVHIPAPLSALSLIITVFAWIALGQEPALDFLLLLTAPKF